MITGEIKNDFEFIKYDMKIFDDLPLHIKSNLFKSVREMINQRRAWLKNERKIP